MEKSIFLIMSSNSFDESELKRNILNKIGRKFGYNINSPYYDRYNPKFNIKNTMDLICKSDLIIADLTNERPSCYFELGLAEAVGSKILVLAKSYTQIHQTSYREYVIYFDNIEDFEVKIYNILKY